MITLHLHPCTVSDKVPLTLCWENFSLNVLLPESLELAALNNIVATLDRQFKVHPISSYEEGYFWVNVAVSQHTNFSALASKPFQPVSS
ncbi:MAG: hypothetical protein AAF728_03590 [Cyanobacteria bacterium P01_D01_bin.128]